VPDSSQTDCDAPTDITEQRAHEEVGEQVTLIDTRSARRLLH
jgi:hypothetical protein